MLHLRFKVFAPVALVTAFVTGSGCSSDLESNNTSTDAGAESGNDASDAALDGGSDSPTDVKQEADAKPLLMGTHVWSKRFGNDANGYVRGQVAIDAMGNVVVAGIFRRSVDFGGVSFTNTGKNQLFVVKFDANGKHLWSKAFSDTNGAAGQPAIDATGNIFMAGSFEGTLNFGGNDLTSAGGLDAFVVKFDASGNHVWSKRFGGTGTEVCPGIAVSGGNIVLLGTFTSTIDFGGGGLSPAPAQFLATLSTAGDHVWSKVPANVAGTTTLYQEHLRVDGEGSIVFAGGFSGTIDFGSGALTPPANGVNVFVAKFASGGGHTWSKRFGDYSQQTVKDVALDASGNILLTGDGGSAIDFGSGPITLAPAGVFAAKLDASGKGSWAKGFSFANGNANGIAVDAFGDAVITGNYSGQVDFGGGPLPFKDGGGGGRAAYVAKLQGSGVHAWSKGWTGVGLTAAAGSPAFDRFGNLVVTGVFGGRIDVGGGVLTSVSSEADLLLAQFGP